MNYFKKILLCKSISLYIILFSLTSTLGCGEKANVDKTSSKHRKPQYLSAANVNSSAESQESLIPDDGKALCEQCSNCSSCKWCFLCGLYSGNHEVPYYDENCEEKVARTSCELCRNFCKKGKPCSDGGICGNGASSLVLKCRRDWQPCNKI